MFNHSYVTGGFRAGVQVQRKVNLVWDNLKVHSEVRAAASCRRVRLTGGHLLFFFFLLVFSPLMCKQRENVTSNELGICCAHSNLGLANCKQSNILWLSLSTHSLPFGEREETPGESRNQYLVESPSAPESCQEARGGLKEDLRQRCLLWCIQGSRVQASCNSFSQPSAHIYFGSFLLHHTVLKHEKSQHEQACKVLMGWEVGVPLIWP